MLTFVLADSILYNCSDVARINKTFKYTFRDIKALILKLKSTNHLYKF